MPTIRQYDPTIPDVRPTETGIDATLQAARRGGAFFNQAAEARRTVGDQQGRMFSSAFEAAGNVAVDYAQHQEISHGAAAFAGLNDALTQQWNDKVKNADPNDPNVAAQFREQVLEPQLEKFGQSFLTEGGQKWAEARVDALRNHMFEKTAADMSSLAKQAVDVNVHTTANSLSNTANLDPTSVPHLLDSADALVGGIVDSSPNIKGVVASGAKLELTQKMKEAIVKSGAVGAIQNAKDPEAEARKWGEKYPEFINGAELKTLGTLAKSQMKANMLTDRQLQLYEKQQQADAAHKELSKTWTDSVTFDDNGKATVKPDFYKKVMDTETKYPGAATERARSMINWGQSEQREKRETIITDKTTQAALYDGLFNTDKPTSDVDILKASAEHKLDAHDTSVLLNLSKAMEEQPLKGPLYQGTMTAVKNVFGDSELGHERYATFLQKFIPEYLKQQRAGTLPSNALSLDDPKSLISQSMEGLKLTPQQKMMGAIFKRIGGGGDITPDMLGALQGEQPKQKPTITLPALKDRVVGEIYRTNSGNRKWTGTGWVLPEQ